MTLKIFALFVLALSDCPVIDNSVIIYKIENMKRLTVNKNLTATIILGICLCFADWAISTLNGRYQFVATNCTGLILGIITMLYLNIKDFLKIRFYVWTGLMLLVSPAAIVWGINHYPYRGQWVSGVLNVILYGYVILYLFDTVRKNFAKIISGNLMIWIAMMLLMIVSKHESIWPAYFLIIFLSFYNRDYSQNQRKEIFLGLSFGIIIGFFIIQGLALVFRPYDEVRYLGLYANANMNALFYVLTFCSVLSLLIYVINNAGKKTYKIFLLLLLACIFSFTILSGSRAAIITEFVTFIVFSVILLTFVNKAQFFKLIIVFALFIVLSALPVYLAVRYIPTVHLHPVYFEGEYSEDKVLPGEAGNSEKYVSAEDVIRNNFGRILKVFVKSEKNDSENDTPEIIAETDGFKQTSSESVSLSSADERFIIYKWYLTHLNILGHSVKDETGVFVYEGYIAPHAHNVFLQMAYWFGIPAGLLFIYFVIQCCIQFIKLLKNKKHFEAAILGCFVTSFTVFGMFELVWHPGRLSFTIFFMMLYFVMHPVMNENYS